MISISQHITKKITPVLRAIIGALIVIFSRLCYLQIKQWHYFKERSTKNFLRIERVPSLRGNIVDSTGIILATNRPVVLISWQGTGNTQLSDEQSTLLVTLCSVLGIDSATLATTIARAEKLRNRMLLARDISFETLCCIAESWGIHPNIHIDTEFQRYYPEGAHACHVVGYLGSMNSQQQGIMGLESIAHDDLKGVDGTKQKTVNSQGKELCTVTIDQGQTGATMQTTLNSKLQHIAEEIFPSDCTGALLVMDPDGAIKVLLSRPSFDPALFLQQITPSQWQILQKDQPFLNRVTQACYPIGSVFKLVTTSFGIEHKVICPHSTWYCPGYYTYRGRNYWCNQRRGHGKLTTLQAVAKSCNILFFDIGSKTDIDLIAHYARKFGLGTKTGALIPEKQGIVPSRAWKYEHRGEAWWQGETLSVAIGQGPLVATPLQVARMINSIFTGFLVKPRILESEEIEREPLAIQPDTLAFLKESMEEAVISGTGQRARTKDMKIYAKTSTAQVSDLSKRNQDKRHLEHGWFVAQVTYKQEKPFTLVIVAEHAGSSMVSVDIAKKFLMGYKKEIDVEYKKKTAMQNMVV
jgi:penicillin-binding protein 2